ncbi:helix-turn-helix domain-containing protein [Streptomyces celluloflavus]|uniref:helix-turn-helix domain-containing protein n=1 Tax=Streptomyces celluloflavus TaxID=58344 RepID=UPI0036B45E37
MVSVGSSESTKCGYCRKKFVQNQGPGRKREYCSATCRRRAQRRRDGLGQHAVEPQLPLGREIAADLQRLAAQLLDAEYAHEDLERLLVRAAELKREVDYYSAAAVQDARHAGMRWEGVAQAAHLTVETARTRWSSSRVERQLRRRAEERGATPVVLWKPAMARRSEAHSAAVMEVRTPHQQPSGAASGAMTQLAAALSHLQETSGTSIRQVAQHTMLSPSYVSRILSGDRPPSWDLVCSLASAFDADPAQLRALWEAAHGITAPASQPVHQRIARLQAALQGLHLSAGNPSAAQIARTSGGTVTTAEARRTLDGHDVPEWHVLGAIVTALGGRPADIKPLWESVHYSVLMCDDPAAAPQNP